MEVVHELRQVVTNPSKLGYGYSVPGIGMGAPAKMGEEVKTSKWGFAEIEHSVDPYDMARQYENAERKFNQEALLGRPPFKTVSHALDFFDHKKGAPPHSPRARARPHGRDSSCAARADPRPRRAPRRCTPSRSAPCARQSRCSPPPPTAASPPTPSHAPPRRHSPVLLRKGHRSPPEPALVPFPSPPAVRLPQAVPLPRSTPRSRVCRSGRRKSTRASLSLARPSTPPARLAQAMWARSTSSPPTLRWVCARGTHLTQSPAVCSPLSRPRSAEQTRSRRYSTLSSHAPPLSLLSTPHWSPARIPPSSPHSDFRQRARPPVPTLFDQLDRIRSTRS